MHISNRAAFWLFLAVILLTFTYAVSDVIAPFIVGIFLGYLLDPAADRLEKAGLGRNLASGTILLVFILFAVVIAVFISPIIYNQLSGLVEALPTYFERFKNELLPRIIQFVEQVDPNVVESVKASSADIGKKTAEVVTDTIGGILSSGFALVNFLSLLIITPIVSFYTIRDWDRMTAKIDSLLPLDKANKIRGYFRDIDVTLSGFLRGQTYVCLALGLFYAVALSAYGLEFGFVIGMATGILSFIPYVGNIFGFITSMTVAYFQYGDITDLLIIAAIFGVGQILEGYILVPKLVGDKIGLHPVWIIFALLAGASLAGFVGLLVALPVAAVIGVFVRAGVDDYKASEFYKPKTRKVIVKAKKKVTTTATARSGRKPH